MNDCVGDEWDTSNPFRGMIVGLTLSIVFFWLPLYFVICWIVAKL